MMIDKETHSARPWKVNEIGKDFILWDVWEIPIAANNSKTENFQAFYRIAFETFKKMQTKTTLVSILFTLRFWMDKIFPLDRNINILPIPGCRETSVKSRLSSQDLEKSKVGMAIKDKNTVLEFRPVYLFEDESLHELSNDTVHGLIHVGWIKKNDNYYTATLAIYVIPRGIYGKVYLKLIEPFRHHIVYPVMTKAMKAQWQEYLLSKD
ncbi:MAG: DUF2867 domain-containing protein [Candidatus Methanoperedens sp.]|nr:DUF2867 domain-containing protein [Candidatus Methanoperedens sp.]